jgi:serine/threonine protein kinase/Tfp pilus assembly protein PilF
MNELDLFAAAIALTDSDARAALLDKECAGQPDLRNRLDQLIAAHFQSNALLDAPAAVQTSDEAGGRPTISVRAADETVGTLIAGRYKLLEQIGEGGFGLVFVAEQQEPVRRKVALKVIKPGMDTRQIIARFEAERQALALMDHPNIARVLDAGATESGRPYFVMELVRGIPITDYCDRNQLAPRERLDLYVTVCQAIQHAHQKGIIHRDIKPNNVLVTSHDGKPVVKVIDFGVAKAISQHLTDRTIYTQFAQMIGTPLYMSPEQAEMSGLDIDTRSDIYSLGVLLYELLTGTTPLDKKRFAKAAYDEIRRLIREEEPPKPSTRLSSLSGVRELAPALVTTVGRAPRGGQSGGEPPHSTLGSIAAMRHTEPAKLLKLIRGDLDWITMKCLEKDRTRRYETANGLARDIQRYLGDEPVEACPPSASYRLRKFARKNRAALSTAAAISLLIVVGAGAILVQQTLHARAIERKNTALEAQRKRAEAREQMAIDAVKRFRDAVVEEPTLKNNPALESLRKKLLKEPLAFFKSLREQLQADKDTRPEVLASIAHAAHEYAHLSEEIGNIQDSLRVHVESLAIWQNLTREHATEPDYWAGLAAIENCRGNMLRKTGHPDQALESHGKALAILERLARENPRITQFQRNLARSHNNIGVLQSTTGHPDQGLESHGKALAIRERPARENLTEASFQSDLATSHHNIGLIQYESGHPDQALQSYGKAFEIQERLARENPSVTSFQSDLAISHHNIGIIQYETGHPEQALESYGKALAIHEKLAAEFPTVPKHREVLGNSHNFLGVLHKELGELQAAEEHYLKALTIREKLAAEFPADPGYHVDLGGSYCNFGNLIVRDRPDESLDWYEKAVRTLTPIHEQSQLANKYLRNSIMGRAGAYERLQKYAEAVNDRDRAIELRASNRMR